MMSDEIKQQIRDLLDTEDDETDPKKTLTDDELFALRVRKAKALAELEKSLDNESESFGDWLLQMVLLILLLRQRGQRDRPKPRPRM